MRARTAAQVVLGSAWLFIAAAKMFDPSRGRSFLDLGLSSPSANFAAWLVVFLEFALGATLVGSNRRGPIQLAVILSICVLATYGTWALLNRPTQCGCAGRVAKLTPAMHSLLVSALLAIGAVGLFRRGEEPLRGWTGSRIALATVCVLAAAFMSVFVERAPEQPHRLDDLLGEPTASLQPRALSPAPTHRSTTPRPDSGPEVGTEGLESLTVETRDRSERAVPNARFWLIPLGTRADLMGGSSASGTTDGQGHGSIRFRRGLPATHVGVWADGFLPAAQALPTPLPSTVSVVLESGTAIRGRVQDEGGRPVSDAVVLAVGRGGRDVLSTSEHGFGLDLPVLGRGRTKEDGTFLVSGVASVGDLSLWAELAGFASPDKASGGVRVDWKYPEREYLLTLQRMSSLRVLAVDAESHEPIPHATYAVALKRSAGWRDAPDSTLPLGQDYVAFPNENGAELPLARTRADADPKAPIRVEVKAPGYTTQRVSIEVGARDRTIVELRRDRPGALLPVRFAVVFDDLARKFTGVLQLGLLTAGQHLEAQVRFEDGVCQKDFLLPEGRWRVTSGYGSGTTLLWRNPQPEPAIVDVREPGGSIELHVKGGKLVLVPRREDGTAIRDFWVNLGDPVEESFRTWPRSWDLLADDVSGSGIVLYADPGEKRLEVVADGFQAAEKRVVVPEDGGEVRWEPILVRTPR